MDCEIVLAEDYIRRGEGIIRAMAAHSYGAGVRVKITRGYEAWSKNLMTYGLGHFHRKRDNEAHIRGGGRLIGWDLGYWDRVGTDCAMRVTIDEFHPWRLIKPEEPSRFDAAAITLREDADPAGPIILCGISNKQRSALGIGGQTWERAALARIRAKFPGRRVIFRPKRPEPTLHGCTMATGTIEETLRGASLLVCAHSNTAIDACIAGVPVFCEDGAAFALYRDNPNPTREQRLEFMRGLAWWQWKPSEAAAAWDRLKLYMIE